MRREELERLLDVHGPDRVIEVLRDYVSPARRDRIEAVLAGRLTSVQVAIESPSDPHNAAAIVRTAEAFGVGTVHVVAAEGEALHAKRTTQGAFHWVDTHHHRDLGGFLAAVGSTRATLLGGDVGADRPVSRVPVDRPVCLLFGNEQRGLSLQARAACEDLFRIPMYGMSESLNLSVSGAVSLYDVTTRRRELLARDGELAGDALVRMRARYYTRGVDDRILRGLLGQPVDG